MGNIPNLDTSVQGATAVLPLADSGKNGKQPAAEGEQKPGEPTLGKQQYSEDVRLARELINALVPQVEKENLALDGIEVDSQLKEISKITGLKIKGIRATYNKQVAALRADNKGDAQSEQQITTFTEEESAAGKELSLKANIYLEHRDVYEKLGYCGDDSLKDTGLNANISRLLLSSTGYICTGASGSGKTELWNMEERLVPPECIISFTSMSENALNYLGSVENKILKMGELPPRKPGEGDDTPAWSYLRQLISDDKLERGIPEKREDGSFVFKRYVTKGPCAIWATTTRSAQDFIDEVVNRCNWVHSDESEKTTKAVNTKQSMRDEEPFEFSAEDELKICRTWQAYHAGLKPYPVIIPYARYIKPNPKYVTARRLYPLISNHIKLSALAHQATREKRLINKTEYLVATVEDYENVYLQIKANAPKVLESVAPAPLEAFKAIRDRLPEMPFTIQQLGRLLKQPEATVYRWKRQYENAGLIEPSGMFKGRAALYHVGAHPDEIEVMNLGIVKPGELKKAIGKATSSKDADFEPLDDDDVGLDDLLG